MILSAQSIRRRCTTQRPEDVLDWQPLVEPFTERAVHRPTGTSYGLGAASYDVRLGQAVILAPGGFKLAVTFERFAFPYDLAGDVKDKSSLVRMGLSVQNTHIDPGWRGWLTLELHNMGQRTLEFAEGSPIAQIRFEMLDEPTELPYSGKYQNQGKDPVPARREG